MTFLKMSTNDRLFVPEIARQYQKNSSPDFVGLAQLKSIHAKQVSEFRKWKSNKEWIQFHQNHYDWWTFPINDKSSFGLAYTIFKEEIDLLQTDSDFMNNFREGLHLIALSWAWNIETNIEIPESQRDTNQQWGDWGVRLYKACRSAYLLNCMKEGDSLKQFGRLLLSRNRPIRYHIYDFSPFFISEYPHDNSLMISSGEASK